MTPMQILKNQFDEFKYLAKNFKEISLNKSEPKTFVSQFCGDRTTYENRGVKADFIKLFKIKFNKINQFTIGFEFKYLELTENDFKIKVSIKKGEELFLFSEDLSILEFKEKFIKLISESKSIENLDNQLLIEMVVFEFNLTSPQSKKRIRKG